MNDFVTSHAEYRCLFIATLINPIAKSRRGKLEHVQFQPTISADEKVGRFNVIQHRFFSQPTQSGDYYRSSAADFTPITSWLLLGVAVS